MNEDGPDLLRADRATPASSALQPQILEVMKAQMGASRLGRFHFGRKTSEEGADIVCDQQILNHRLQSPTRFLAARWQTFKSGHKHHTQSVLELIRDFRRM